MPTTTNAIMHAFAAFSPGLENCRYAELPDPVALQGQTTVKLEASALNHLDLWIARGHPSYNVQYPHVLGSDGAGILQTDIPQRGLKKGDRVVILPSLYCGECDACLRGLVGSCDKSGTIGAQPWGTHAEFTCVPEKNVFAIRNLSFEQAASLPIGGLTAMHMLRRADVKAGQSVLVWGAASSVGSYGIQIAQQLGANVITTASGDKVERAAKTFGADVAVIDYKKEDVGKRVKELTGGKGVDAIMEIVGPATWKASMESVRKGGCIVTCGAVSGGDVTVPLRWLYSNQIRFIGSKQGTPDEFKQVLEWAEDGKIKPVIGSTYPLSDAKAALGQLARGEGFGKTVLRR